MPIYEFKCEDCGHIEDRMLKIAEASEVQRCPKCSGIMHKVFSAPNVHLDVSFPGAAIKKGNEYRKKAGR